MSLNEHVFPLKHIRKATRPGLWIACTGVFFLSNVAAQEPADQEMDDAQELRRYSVEIIVFSYARNTSAGSEIFIPDPVEVPSDFPLEPTPEPLLNGDPPVDSMEDPQTAPDSELVPLGDSGEDAVPAFGDLLEDFENQELVELIAGDRIDLRIMTPDELTMVDIHDKLILLDAYEPVLWAGWTQATLAEAETPSIRLRRLGNLPLTFEGNLKLYLSRFLHLVVDVTMDGEPPLPANPDDDSPTEPFDRGYLDEFGYPIYSAAPLPALYYRISENRIVETDDLRYFDHPKFGIVAKIGRFEKPAEEDEEGLEEPEEQPDPASLATERLDAT